MDFHGWPLDYFCGAAVVSDLYRRAGFIRAPPGLGPPRAHEKMRACARQRTEGVRSARYHTVLVETEGGCMKLIAMAAVASIALAAAGVASAQEALAKSSGCLNCHSVDAKKIGPGFKEVAAKYKGKADAEATLTAKISAGKEHPAVKATGDDVKSLVKWVLSL
jgi:cytochrome c